MEITYIGPHDDVEVALAGGTILVVARGETIEVLEAEAAGYLAQETNWRPTKRRKKEED